MRARSLGAIATVVLLILAMPATAGPVADAATAYGRGDYATVVAKIRETRAADWLALQAFSIKLGDTLYGEIANDQLARIRPDPVQPVLAPPVVAQKRSGLHAEADPSCRFAVSFNSEREGSTKLWRMPAGELIAAWAAPVDSAAVSAQYLATDDGQDVRVYEAETGAFVRSIVRPTGVPSVALFFSGDGVKLFLIPQLRGGGFRAKGGRVFDVPSGMEVSAATAEPPPYDFVRSRCPVVTRQTFSS